MRTPYADCSAPLIRLPVWGETDAVLMEDWHIEDVANFTFTVPAGTTTDGASIPRFLWRVCGHPLEAPRVYAAMLHDWLYAGVDPDDTQGVNCGISASVDSKPPLNISPFACSVDRTTPNKQAIFPARTSADILQKSCSSCGKTGDRHSGI